MAYLNVNIPLIYCQIRREYLYDLKAHHGEVEDCMVFGLASMAGRPLFFHALMENGGVYYRLPLSAFIQHGFEVKDVPRMQLHELELWNCFSYYPSITVFDALTTSGKYLGKDKKWYRGSYLFTVDWASPDSNIVDTDHSEIPQEHKCAHVMALENGNYAAQPNNRILWHVPSYTVRNEIPDWEVNTQNWSVEDGRDWQTEDTNKFFYDIEDKKNGK